MCVLCVVSSILRTSLATGKIFYAITNGLKSRKSWKYYYLLFVKVNLHFSFVVSSLSSLLQSLFFFPWIKCTGTHACWVIVFDTLRDIKSLSFCSVLWISKFSKSVFELRESEYNLNGFWNVCFIMSPKHSLMSIFLISFENNTFNCNKTSTSVRT